MKILIAIHGAHSQPEQMAAQRDTWLRHIPNVSGRVLGLAYRYFVGQRGEVSRGLDPADIVEVNSPDGPIWEGPHRTWHLNRKTEAICRFALDGGYDFAFKCDDDTYAHVDRLLASGFEDYDYSGNLDWHHAAGVGRYQWAQGGAGYCLSRRAMEIVANNGLHLARAEDFAVGQLLARHGIKAFHDPRYIPAATESDFTSQDAITLHKISHKLMRHLHAGQAQIPTTNYRRETEGALSPCQ